MLSTHKSNYASMGILLAMTFAKLVIDIPPTVMTLLSTACLVYIGCLFSTKLCTYDKKAKEGVETMKSKDAWLFPIISSGVLFGLFLVFKYFNQDIVNVLFHVYFTLIGAFSISSLINEKICEKPAFKKFAEKPVFTIPKIYYLNPEPVSVSQLDIITYCMGLVVAVTYFVLKNWILNNILGMAFSIFGIENLLLSEYKVGLILLSLLFFYDIFWVFFTPVMVSVAKNLKGPIKLMFPKHFNPVEVKDYNMIGLGDIVVPGVYVALMLRFDIHLYTKKGQDAKNMKFNFTDMKYFLITFIFYVLGIGLTLFVMIFFNHAQPALLYLVPCTLISSTVMALVKGEFKELWAFNEEKLSKENEEDEDEEDDDGKKKSKKKNSEKEKKKSE